MVVLGWSVGDGAGMECEVVVLGWSVGDDAGMECEVVVLGWRVGDGAGMECSLGWCGRMASAGMCLIVIAIFISLIIQYLRSTACRFLACWVKLSLKERDLL